MPKLSGITWKWLRIGVNKKAHVLGQQRGDQGREPQQEDRGREPQQEGLGRAQPEGPGDPEEQPRGGMGGAPPYDPGTSFGNDFLVAVFFII